MVADGEKFDDELAYDLELGSSLRDRLSAYKSRGASR